jgi:uncharacterized protein (DUF1800 family)
VTLEAVIAANRFGLGARPGELQAIGGDPRGWLARQVAGSRPIPKDVASLPSSAQAFRVFADGQQQRRDAKQAADEGDIAKRIGEKIRTQLVPLYQDQVAARYRVAVHTEEPFRERLVHFWTNHFAVSADKVQVIALAGTLENEAIRPNLGGSFVDMLLAVESHPAMILYLDNQASVGPNSPLAHRVAKRLARKPDGRKLDINENLAREILELHTLGVNGGYTQADVTTFARALTGWSIGSERGPIAEGEPGKFEFRDMAHEPGAKTILGHKYSEEGVAQPRTVLRDLARHPATAQHIATKLARHFVADEPSQGVVDKLAKVFLDSNGDLPTLHRALIDIPQAWANATAKFKTPHDFVVSTYRMLDFVPAMPQQILAPFQLLGQRPYAPGSPAGWPDTAGQWDGPDALLKRIEWADQIGQRTGTRFQPLDLGLQSLGAALAERTRTAITRAESAAQGITLLLASPDFQRR